MNENVTHQIFHRDALVISETMNPSSTALFYLFAALVLAGCEKSKHSTAPVHTLQEVGVVTLKPQKVAITVELPGRITAFRVSDVRPQVDGIILKRLFTEGGDVTEGQQLYQIDPARYQAAYDSAKATVARSEATLVLNQLTERRQRKLLDTRVISSQDHDNAYAALKEAEAAVAAWKATLEAAQINLNYTKVLSPISGRIGRSSVTEGALVANGQSTALAKVTQLDPIYVDVTQASSQLLRLQRALNKGQLQSVRAQKTSVRLTLEDGSEYPEKGTLEFSEVSVDTGTGSVTLRAIFPNPNHILLPGMFVRAQGDAGVDDQAILVPQRAVSRNQKGEPTVLVVGADNKVELRPFQTERTIGGNWLVTAGLKAGDKVIIEGLQKVAPGAQVKTVELSGDGAPVVARQ